MPNYLISELKFCVSIDSFKRHLVLFYETKEFL